MSTLCRLLSKNNLSSSIGNRNPVLKAKSFLNTQIRSSNLTTTYRNPFDHQQKNLITRKWNSNSSVIPLFSSPFRSISVTKSNLLFGGKKIEFGTLQDAVESSKKARSSFKKKDVRTAVEQMERALYIYRDLNDKPRQWEALDELGFFYTLEKQFDAGIEVLEEAIAIAISLGEQKKQMKSSFSLGLLFIEFKNDAENGIRHLKAALKIAEETKSLDFIHRCSSMIGIAYDKDNLPELAIKYFQIAIPCYRELKEPMQLAQVMSMIAKSYVKLKQPKKATNTLEELIVELKSDPYHGWIVSEEIGNIHFINGNFEDAEMSFRRSLSMAKETKKPEKMIQSMQSLSKTLLKMGSLDEAMQINQEMYTLAQAKNLIHTESQALLNMATVHMRQLQFEESKIKALQALNISEASNASIQSGWARETLGELALIEENTAEAKEMFELAIEDFNECKKPLEKRRVLNRLAEINCIASDWEEALMCYAKAMLVHEELRDDVSRMNCFAKMTELYSRLGKEQEAAISFQYGKELALALKKRGAIQTVPVEFEK